MEKFNVGLLVSELQLCPALVKERIRFCDITLTLSLGSNFSFSPPPYLLFPPPAFTFTHTNIHTIPTTLVVLTLDGVKISLLLFSASFFWPEKNDDTT